MPMGCVHWGGLVMPPFPHSTFQNSKQGCGQKVLGWFRDRTWTIYEFGDIAWISSTILFNLIHVWQRKLLVKKIVHLSLTFPGSGSFMSDSVQLFSYVWLCPALCPAPWTAACQASLSITNSWSLLKLMSIELVMPSNHLILCHPLLLPPSVFPRIKVFSSETVLHIRWPKYWSFRFSIRPSNEYSGLISFRINWLDLLAVQGTLKSLFQHHSSKASILQCSAFFTAHLSHPYMTTGKTIALTRWTFVAKVMSLLFLMCCLGWS